MLPNANFTWLAMYLNALLRPFMAPVLLKPCQKACTVWLTPLTALSIPLLRPFANLCTETSSILPRVSMIPSIPLMALSLSFSKTGCNFVETVSYSPPTASSTDLYLVAKCCIESPARLNASAKSSVLISPFWILLTRSSRDMPISLATAAIPAGDCSIINLKSCHWILGLVIAWTICWLSVFMACFGFSAEAARPPIAFTKLPASLRPIAAICENVVPMSEAE